MIKIKAILIGALAFAVAIFRGNMHKARAEKAAEVVDGLKGQRVARDKANKAMNDGVAAQKAKVKEVKQDESTKRDHFSGTDY